MHGPFGYRVIGGVIVTSDQYVVGVAVTADQCMVGEKYFIPMT